jgi:predicted nucleotidyltransferase component of viral defense system
MIGDDEIERKADEFKIPPISVQKDFVYGWLLKGLSLRQPLAARLVLKGGNALRKGYLPDTRFSKDLDFSSDQQITRPFLERELREVCGFVTAQTGISFTEKMVIKEKDLPIPGIEALEARLYFKSFYGEENLSLRTQLDITQFDKIYLPVQNRQLLHQYSDAPACSGIIRCQKLEEILASKLTTLLHRRNAGDLFDLLYAIVFRDIFGVNRREVITTFLKKSIFESQPVAARDELRKIQIPSFRELWASISAPISSIFSFEYALANFQSLLDSLFSLVIPGIPLTGGLGPPTISRPLGRAGQSIGITRTYFPSDVRNTIISAGRTRRMVRLSYDGYDRFVEPYKLEYYVRKKDGQGLEYFWGWDTSGGSSGKIGIKQFICDKIRSVQITDRVFSPRFTVEF